LGERLPEHVGQEADQDVSQHPVPFDSLAPQRKYGRPMGYFGLAAVSVWSESGTSGNSRSD
jgi:hypothetical protein